MNKFLILILLSLIVSCGDNSVNSNNNGSLFDNDSSNVGIEESEKDTSSSNDFFTKEDDKNDDDSSNDDTTVDNTDDETSTAIAYEDVEAIRGKLYSTGSSYSIKADNGATYALDFGSNNTFSGFSNALVIATGEASKSGSSYNFAVSSFRIAENGYSSDYVRSVGMIKQDNSSSHYLFLGDDEDEYILEDFDMSDYEDVDFSKEVFMLAKILSDTDVDIKILMNNDIFGEGYDDSKTSESNIIRL